MKQTPDAAIVNVKLASSLIVLVCLRRPVFFILKVKICRVDTFFYAFLASGDEMLPVFARRPTPYNGAVFSQQFLVMEYHVSHMSDQSR